MGQKDRVYFCIDMKSFFASVECAELGLDSMETNLVVADPDVGEGAICLAVTPKMKSLGVKNRCRIYEISKNINYIIKKPRMKKYIEYAAEIYAIYLKYIDKSDIHVYSIDECFIDATDYLKIYNLKAMDFVQKLMNEIKEKLNIPSSAGIGTNMYLAKIALDITAKHSSNRVGWLDENKYRRTLWNHKPITDFWQISKGTEKRLAKWGLYDMESITRIDEKILYKEFGVNAEFLIDHAWGKESCTIADIKSYKTKAKSISNSQILPRNYAYNEALLVMREMIQMGCYRLAKENYVTDLVHIYVGYGDRSEASSKGSVRMGVATNLYSLIIEYVDKLFEEIVSKKAPIRKIGYDFGDLKGMDGERYDFFTDIKKVEKEKKLVKNVLKIQDKFGKNAVLKGMDLLDGATQKERNSKIGGHNSE